MSQSQKFDLYSQFDMQEKKVIKSVLPERKQVLINVINVSRYWLALCNRGHRV